MEHLQRQPATQEAQPMVKESAPKPERITKKAWLLVEGKDPLNFFGGLCNELSLSQKLQIMNFGGVKELRGFLIGLRGASGFADVKSIGIIRDAEEDSTRAFQSVKSKLGGSSRTRQAF